MRLEPDVLPGWEVISAEADGILGGARVYAECVQMQINCVAPNQPFIICLCVFAVCFESRLVY